MITKQPHYPYMVGCLEGFLLTLPFKDIPGVTINDMEAFKNFIKTNLNKIEDLSIEYRINTQAS